MDKGFLTEAFKELKMLNEEDYNLNNKDEIEDMHDTVFNQLDDKSIDIIDPNAQSVDDLEDSYVGKVILDCDVCHSKIYKDPSEVIIDDESSLANIDEECPYCYSTDGYKIIGEVASYDGASLEDDDEDDDEDDTEEDDTEEDDEDSINEGILGKAVGGNLVGSTVGAGLGTALGSVAGVPGMIAGGIAGSALGRSAGSKLAAGSELLKDDIAPSKGQRKFKHLKSIDECNASNNSKS